MKTFLLAVLFTVYAHAEVREITKMTDIESAVTPDTLVVFDIDNTILEPRQTLGSDQWFEATREKVGHEKAIELWSKVQGVTEVQPVEPSTPALIRRLRQRAVGVIALTARPEALADTTRAQLKSIGVEMPLILFAGETPKGEVLSRHLRSAVGRVIFVDDKAKHTKTVEASMAQRNIPYVGFRYGAADPKVHAYDADVASVQWKYFGRILDDEAARELSEMP